MTEPEILQVPGVGYMVRSKSVPGAWRLVAGKVCSCPAGERRSCRHRRLVARFCADLDRLHARPVAPVHVAALVD